VSDALPNLVSLHMQRTMPRRLALVFFWALLFFGALPACVA
jgi:hypothetical protein